MITLEFDHHPDRVLTGNSRAHWAAISRASNSLKEETWALLQQQGLLAHDCPRCGGQGCTLSEPHGSEGVDDGPHHGNAANCYWSCGQCWGQKTVNKRSMLRATVTYHSYWCGKQMDADNLIKGCKSILDSIVAENVLRDDGPAFVTIAPPVYTRVKTMKERKLVVTVEEAP